MSEMKLLCDKCRATFKESELHGIELMTAGEGEITLFLCTDCGDDTLDFILEGVEEKK